VSFLYTSCMLRGAFTLFINFFAYLSKHFGKMILEIESKGMGTPFPLNS
jgi:hypothetical protein